MGCELEEGGWHSVMLVGNAGAIDGDGEALGRGAVSSSSLQKVSVRVLPSTERRKRTVVFWSIGDAIFC